MAAAACESCGSTTEVRLVAFSIGDEHRTAFMCETCKSARLARRKVRHRADPGRYLHRHRVWRSLREGGVQAWIGFGLLVIGLGLVPLYAFLALVIR
jgi:hypothetical protein